MDRSSIPAPAHTTGDSLHGFTIEAITPLQDIKALAYEATHTRTGARVLHIHCNDEENMFSVGFRTPPPDSTGVAHILEHSVLAGSKQFPVKDCFKELSKRTLNTFLNAMTWPDRTIYPTCSTVRADYFNLATVYCDLVLNPLLRRQTFQQEGHHLEFAEAGNTDSELKISGVVYNEMKGAFSAPEAVVGRKMVRELRCDTPYGHESGGDPEVIPDLTFEDFCEFHRLYYSPSNARFMLYGDVGLTENLAFLEGVLAPFEKVDVDSTMGLQGRWGEPRSAAASYPVGPEDDTSSKSFVALGWLLNECADTQLTLALEVAVDALVGSSAAPLRKALVDAGLGTDVWPSGCQTEGLQSLAMVGLRGTEVERADEIEQLILDTLKQVADEGLSADLIEGSLHQVEFSGKEISPPFPIWLLVRANAPWYADADPKSGLEFGKLVEQTRALHADNPRYFDELIREWLVDNPHRLRLVVSPSNTLSAERDAALAEKLAARKEQMSPDERVTVDSQAQALLQAQQTPDSAEDLATLPVLSPEDIPRDVRTLPTESRDSGSVRVLEHPVFSNGIGYVGVTFDVSDLTEEEAPLLPLLGRATTGMGAAGLDYEALSKRIGRFTGGLGASNAAGIPLSGGAPFLRWHLDGRALARNLQELFAILGDVLTAPDTSDHKRLSDLVRESASRISSRLVPAGHQFALYRAAATLGLPFWRREQWSGTAQVALLKRLAKDADAESAGLAERISALQQRLFTRSRVQISVAGDPDIVAASRPLTDALIAALPEGDAPAGAPAATPWTAAPRHAGVAIPADVNYVGQLVKTPNMTDPSAPALGMLANILSADYLYKKLRVEGGAYGGFSFYLPDSGAFAMLSYRDPNLEQTLDVYRGVLSYIADALDDGAVEASRIGALGKLDRVLSPEQQLGAGRTRALYGVTDAVRQAYRTGMLEVDAAKIREHAVPLIEAGLADAPRAALGARPRIEEANEKLDVPLTIEELE